MISLYLLSCLLFQSVVYWITSNDTDDYQSRGDKLLMVSAMFVACLIWPITTILVTGFIMWERYVAKIKARYYEAMMDLKYGPLLNKDLLSLEEWQKFYKYIKKGYFDDDLKNTSLEKLEQHLLSASFEEEILEEGKDENH